MIVIPDYREHRIDVNAIAAGEGRWHAAVSIRRTLSDDKSHQETVDVLQDDGRTGGAGGQLWARRFVDLEAERGDCG